MSTNSHRVFSDAVIPYGAYWSTPFVRWQGSFANSHPIKLAADVAVNALAAKGIDPTTFTEVLLGTTVPSKASFFGAPWYATLIGAPGIGGPMVAQACADVCARSGHGGGRCRSGRQRCTGRSL